MNANQMKAKALANTAREVIAMCDNKKFTVAKIIAHWNLCVEQSGFTGTFDCPTCYKRKASIVGDMERIALQLDRIADDRDPLTGESIHAADARCDDEGNDPREWCGNDIQAAHTVALQANGWIDSLTCSKAGADAVFFQMIEGDHAEALEIDAQRDIEAIVESGGAIQVQIDFYALPLDSQRAALVEEAHCEAIAADLAIYLGAAVAEGAAHLDGWVLRHPSGFYYDQKDPRQINPLKASYFTPKEKHLLGQFVTLYGMEALRLGEAVTRSLSEARRVCGEQSI